MLEAKASPSPDSTTRRAAASDPPRYVVAGTWRTSIDTRPEAATSGEEVELAAVAASAIGRRRGRETAIRSGIKVERVTETEVTGIMDGIRIATEIVVIGIEIGTGTGTGTGTVGIGHAIETEIGHAKETEIGHAKETEIDHAIETEIGRGIGGTDEIVACLLDGSEGILAGPVVEVEVANCENTR